MLGTDVDAGDRGTGTGAGGTGDRRRAVSERRARSCCSRPRRSSPPPQKALQAGDLEGYAKAQDEARALVQQALVAAGKAPTSPPPSQPASPTSPSSVAVRLGRVEALSRRATRRRF